MYRLLTLKNKQSMYHIKIFRAKVTRFGEEYKQLSVLLHNTLVHVGYIHSGVKEYMYVVPVVGAAVQRCYCLSCSIKCKKFSCLLVTFEIYFLDSETASVIRISPSSLKSSSFEDQEPCL